MIERAKHQVRGNNGPKDSCSKEEPGTLKGRRTVGEARCEGCRSQNEVERE